MTSLGLHTELSKPILAIGAPLCEIPSKNECKEIPENFMCPNIKIHTYSRCCKCQCLFNTTKLALITM